MNRQSFISSVSIQQRITHAVPGSGINSQFNDHKSAPGFNISLFAAIVDIHRVMERPATEKLLEATASQAIGSEYSITTAVTFCPSSRVSASAVTSIIPGASAANALRDIAITRKTTTDNKETDTLDLFTIVRFLSSMFSCYVAINLTCMNLSWDNPLLSVHY